MKAVGYKTPSPIDAPDALLEIELPMPVATGRDLLVAVKAVSVNPVDTKVRSSAKPSEGELYKVLGFDTAGVVTAVGPECSLFHPGDEVFYAGSISRSGTNAEFHLVDERIVGRKPSTLSFTEAAALPLTSITAWELLFDRLQVPHSPEPSGALLVVGASGGVGSILVQLARKLTGLTIVATASRPDTQQWVRDLGAHHVIDHHQPMPAQLKALGIPHVERIASLNGTEAHYPELVEMLAPQGRFGLIDDPKSLDATKLKRKSASLHWEFMFARPVFETPDMEQQHLLLNEVSTLVDAGVLKSTANEDFGTMNATNLIRAHALLESGKAQGKIILSGF